MKQKGGSESLERRGDFLEFGSGGEEVILQSNVNYVCITDGGCPSFLPAYGSLGTCVKGVEDLSQT